jgi:uncharacterized protein (TIGR03085 family)
VVTYLAAREREALCDTALAAGPDAPTMCGDWRVRELVAHLVLRERSPAAAGIVLPPLADLTERRTRALAAGDFQRLVERVRGGPPWWSPMRVSSVDRLTNTMEMFIHHEDIRRAQPSWKARELSHADADAVWQGVRATGRGLLRKVDVGVEMIRPGEEDAAVLRKGEPVVRIVGSPAEVAMFVYGRKAVADVVLLGPDEAVARLSDTSLGI